MIAITIISKTFEQSEEIVRFLLENRLVIDGTIQNNAICYQLDTNGKKALQTDAVILKCTTKALLFTEIDKLLRKKYKNKVPTLYSTPIVNMDWEQSELLIEETKKV